MTSTVNFTLKTMQYHMNHEAMSATSGFPVKFTLQFTSLAIIFSWTEWALKENNHQAQPQRANWKGKKAISESTVNSQRNQ